MAQGYLLQLRQRTLTDGLLAAAGYKLYVYTAGTTTPVDTFSDSGLTTANTNPLIADANGFFGPMFVAAGSLYKLVLKTDADVSVWTLDGQEPMIASSGSGSVTAVPAGSVVWSPYSTPPTGYLLCDGSAVSRSTYAALAALAAADAYPNGSGDGSTTFNLPDLRGRAPYGVAASGTGSTLGATFGSLDHTHTGPSHTHGVTVTRDGWGISDLNSPPLGATGRIQVGNPTGTGTFGSAYQASGDLALTSDAGGTGNTGTGNAPGVTGYWFIKT